MLRFVLALLIATQADAGPDRASLLLGSNHLGASGFEQVNPGFFLTWEDRALGLDYSAGIYRNSYGRASVAATAALPVVRWQRGQADLFAGVAYYPQDGRGFAVHLGDLVPLAGVQLRHGNAFVQIIPMDGKPVDGLISFGLTFPLGGPQ